MDHTANPHSVNTDNSNSNNVTNNRNINHVNTAIVDENSEIMRWLSPLDSRRRHQDVRNDRLGGMGNSLLETNKFQE